MLTMRDSPTTETFNVVTLLNGMQEMRFGPAYQRTCRDSAIPTHLRVITMVRTLLMHRFGPSERPTEFIVI